MTGKSFIFASTSRIDSYAGVAHEVIEAGFPIGGMIVKITDSLRRLS